MKEINTQNMTGNIFFFFLSLSNCQPSFQTQIERHHPKGRWFHNFFPHAGLIAQIFNLYRLLMLFSSVTMLSGVM